MKQQQNPQKTKNPRRDDDKLAALLFLLREVVPADRLTIVFAATRHHVEFLHILLAREGIDAACVFGAMDQTARKIHVAKFRAEKARAARRPPAAASLAPRRWEKEGGRVAAVLRGGAERRAAARRQFPALTTTAAATAAPPRARYRRCTCSSPPTSRRAASTSR
jgi:hypothetical protein